VRLICILRRIRDNDYEFPTDRNVSPDVKELVQSILTPKPEERPTLHEILDHVFFTLGTFPPHIPGAAYDSVPDFRSINRTSSEINYRKVRKAALLDDDQISIALPKAPTQQDEYRGKSVTSSLAQQEKEFQKAVQPGSPISALLSSARQPLVMAPNSNGAPAARESPLFRKLQAASRQANSPLGPNAKRGLQGIQEEDGVQAEDKGRKELEAHKARILSQMAPNRDEETGQLPALVKGKGKEVAPLPTSRSERDRGLIRERENMPPVASEPYNLGGLGAPKSKCHEMCSRCLTDA
jgi:cell cycle serine/threonine-protein kinase CDC5/MSD2